MPDGSITCGTVIAVALLGLTGCTGQSGAVIHASACGPTTAAPRVWFIEPANGATVLSPVRVRFGVEGYQVRPAGDLTSGTGHHHLIIDSDSIRPAEPIPFDNNIHYVHYGEGQVEAMVNLPPGTHSLTTEFANGQHIACGITETIRITVVSTPIN